MDISTLQVMLGSPIIWAILLVAFVCYGLLIDLTFVAERNESWYVKTRFWYGSLRIMLAVLPLLGLLGTISGLLKTFFRMSVDRGVGMQEVISGGIAEALLTTEMGLMLVVPGLIIYGRLQTRLNKYEKSVLLRAIVPCVHP